MPELRSLMCWRSSSWAAWWIKHISHTYTYIYIHVHTHLTKRQLSRLVIQTYKPRHTYAVKPRNVWVMTYMSHDIHTRFCGVKRNFCVAQRTISAMTYTHLWGAPKNMLLMAHIRLWRNISVREHTFLWCAKTRLWWYTNMTHAQAYGTKHAMSSSKIQKNELSSKYQWLCSSWSLKKVLTASLATVALCLSTEACSASSTEGQASSPTSCCSLACSATCLSTEWVTCLGLHMSVYVSCCAYIILYVYVCTHIYIHIWHQTSKTVTPNFIDGCKYALKITTWAIKSIPVAVVVIRPRSAAVKRRRRGTQLVKRWAHAVLPWAARARRCSPPWWRGASELCLRVCFVCSCEWSDWALFARWNGEWNAA